MLTRCKNGIVCALRELAVFCMGLYQQKGNTALHIASLAGQLEIVTLLVQHDALINAQSQVCQFHHVVTVI